MKRYHVLLVSMFFVSTAVTHAQSLMDYVSAQRGDTLVVKDYAAMGCKVNALYYVLTLDTVNVPAGRVYELKAGGWYPLGKNPTTSAHDDFVLAAACGEGQCEGDGHAGA